MAEALLRHIDSRNFEAFSANTSGQEVHALSIEVIQEIGIDLTQNVSMAVEKLCEKTFDFAITLDELSAGAAIRLTATETVHWKFENPSEISNEPEAQRRAFRSVRDQIAQRLRLFTIVHVRPAMSERTHFAESRSKTAHTH